MFSNDRTLPPTLETVLLRGPPPRASPGYSVIHGELASFVSRGRLGLDLLDRDLKGGDLEAATQTLRTMHRLHSARMKRIEEACTGLPWKQKATALTLRWAPWLTALSIVALVAIDLMDMGGWHHQPWVVPGVASLALAMLHRTARR